ncbi:MAG: glycoside hydrolase family 28 protein [Anaerocolumna sp.]
MNYHLILVTARSVVLELLEDGYFYTNGYDIYINGKKVLTGEKMVQTVYGLKPDTAYTIWLEREDEISEKIEFCTKSEFVTLNVREFGAKGDGISDDTGSIQAAIMSCPENSRVYLPEGIYKFTNLFLKSNMVLELDENSVLSAFTDKSRIPVLPGRIESYEENSEYLLASWEGNPLDSYASLITGINIENVLICGQGTMDGCADFDNWWDGEKRKTDPARPKMFFLNKCRNVTIQGITVMNSPAWNIHPYFSKDLRFIDLSIKSPSKSHNTDGLDPESCNNVEIIGVYFSVGDDCIAVKSGKIYMGKKYKTPSADISISHCYMEKGHGAVTVGSEIGAGVKGIEVKNCIFYQTDRGLRIKTRRGRGEDSVLQDIVFENIQMDNVKTPFVVNSFYYCDPDGKTDYVSCKEPLPVDEHTPGIKNLKFINIDCKDCHVAGGYFYGLPEKKIDSIEMENIHISYAVNAIEGTAAMMLDCDKTSKTGMFVRNVKKLTMKKVVIEGNRGETIDVDRVDKMEIYN